MVENGNIMKWLRILHIASASIWLGATVAAGVLAILGFFYLNETEFIIISPIISILYQKLILPVAILTIHEGLIYGFFTDWGFIKYRWILLKWLLTFLLIASILATIGQLFAVMNKINLYGFAGGFSDGGTVLFCISLQIFVMLIMIRLAIFKPEEQNHTSVLNSKTAKFH